MKLVFVQSNRPVTDSLTVAEAFGKTHDHVIRDIRQQIEKLDEAGEKEWGVTNFGETQYQHPQNKQWYPKIDLTEDAFTIVAMGYVTVEAMKMKVQFINEFRRMREELSRPQFQLPQSMPEALRLLASEMESKAIIASDNERLAIETTEQKKKLKEQEAPIAIYNLAISAKNTMSMQEVAKSLGTGRTRLYEILREESIVMKDSTMPYQRFLDAGYFKVSERPRASGDTVVNDPATRVYAKGFEYIAKLLQKRAERNGKAAELLE